MYLNSAVLGALVSFVAGSEDIKGADEGAVAKVRHLRTKLSVSSTLIESDLTAKQDSDEASGEKETLDLASYVFELMGWKTTDNEDNVENLQGIASPSDQLKDGDEDRILYPYLVKDHEDRVGTRLRNLTLPTASPSGSPTTSPAPTASPSPAPSASPTTSPAPTVSPAPSASPTISPAPTVSPAPSASPTISPAPTVSPAPSASPTISPAPTVSPAPTASPSGSPTPAPSDSSAPSESQPPVPITRYLAERMAKTSQGEEIERFWEEVGAESDFDDSDMLEDCDDAIDFFEGVSEFALTDTSDHLTCECVDCEIDELCGGLWKGNRYQDDSDDSTKIVHIVVSHCMSDLDWLDDFIGNHTVASIHVITKCGAPVRGAPQGAVIKVMPNIGRCDHSYAHAITTIVPEVSKIGDEDNSVVLFLKDDLSSKNMHQHGHWSNFDSLVETASSSNGFACGIVPESIQFGRDRFFLSAYHDTSTLMEFSMNAYSRNIKGYTVNADEFLSPHKTLGSWFSSINGEDPNDVPLVQVCYGGVFAASVRNIKKTDMSIWEAVEKSLSRGNNIQEGHYAERSWGRLLSTPLEPFQIEALKENADGVYLNPSSMHGALLKRPKLYLHVGVQFTTSTERLTESLVEQKDALQEDGYKILVHGKWDGGEHGFPNIDNLGACLWSDIDKDQFPIYAKDATICPTDLLPDLTSFLDHSMKNSSDVVLLNPWLVRPGSARSLQSYLGYEWDIKVVIYYRRYFEWLAMTYDGWRKEIRDNVLSPDKSKIPLSTFRFIDFVREHCKRLFYGIEFNEDGFPVGLLSQTDPSSNVVGNPIPRGSSNGHFYQSRFDPVTDVDVKELTDLGEYTYFVAKEYYSLPSFQHGVTIVNYHDIRSPETNFYCHVLAHANEACREVLDNNLDAIVQHETSKTSKTGYDHFPDLEATKLYEEIVIAAYMKNRLKLRTTKTDERAFRKQVSLWMEMIDYALDQRKIPLSHLPFECLQPFELNRLLEASLEYEKYLLPEFFDTHMGRPSLEREFRKSRFCSVDIYEILQDGNWDFLFTDELQEQFALPKAYVHIGAPKTGSTAIQDSMFADRAALKADKFFIVPHGQYIHLNEPFIQDNVLMANDRLGNCIYDQDEQDLLYSFNKDQVCPDYLMPEFRQFVSNARANNSKLVISNEWLSRRTSEKGLISLLEGWDTDIVLYYRKFYDWMISAHYQWHFDFSMESLEIYEGKIGLVDFFRMFCSRLFQAESPTPEELLSLVDMDSAPSEIWKRFNALPEWDEKVKVVNSHKGDAVELFYCDVLDANETCKMHRERLDQNQETKARTKKSTTFVDLAIAIYFEKRSDSSSPVTLESLNDMAGRIEERLMANGMKEKDLPIECLSASEQRLLLDFSLAAEKNLLPDDYASGGAEAMKEDFEKASREDKFCAVDTYAVLNNPKWEFIVDQLLDEVSMQQ